MSYNSTMMTSVESISFSLPLMGGDLSFWSNDLTKNEFQDGASLDTTIQNMDALVNFKQDLKSSIIPEVDQSNPLPDWMSEKIDISSWLDDFADNPANRNGGFEMDRMSPEDELFNSLAGEDPVPDLFHPRDLDEEPFMAASPGSSIGSGGTAVNSSSFSTMPSSPSSIGSDAVRSDEIRETDLIMEEDTQCFEALINSCKDAGVFLQLAESLPVELPVPAEADVKLLKQDDEFQSDLQLKIKSELKPARGRTKSKGLSKERKERKKGQNKEAATRYRQKKKKESEVLGAELQSLEQVNGDLKGKVSSLEQEIHYLKDLLQEIYKVKGQIKILQSP